MVVDPLWYGHSYSTRLGHTEALHIHVAAIEAGREESGGIMRRRLIMPAVAYVNLRTVLA